MVAKHLTAVFTETVDAWIENRGSFCHRNEWLKGTEGEIYVRYLYSSSFAAEIRNRLDLANFQISTKYQKKGIARSLIEIACAKPVQSVKVELIHTIEWGKKIREYQFPNRKTIVVSHWDDIISVCWDKDSSDD